jgi:hypothetical protein
MRRLTRAMIDAICALSMPSSYRDGVPPQRNLRISVAKPDEVSTRAHRIAKTEMPKAAIITGMLE